MAEEDAKSLAIDDLARRYGRRPETVDMDAYLAALGDYSAQQVDAACRRAVQQDGEFMPSAAALQSTIEDMSAATRWLYEADLDQSRRRADAVQRERILAALDRRDAALEGLSRRGLPPAELKAARRTVFRRCGEETAAARREAAAERARIGGAGSAPLKALEKE